MWSELGNIYCIIFVLFTFQNELFGLTATTKLLAMKNSVCIFVADNQNMKSQVKFELFHPNQWNMMNQIMFKVQTLQRFGIVLDQNTLSLRLF